MVHSGNGQKLGKAVQGTYMNSDVEKYLCTTCGGSFILANGVQQEGGSARGSELVCDTCSMHYPVIGGIPRFVPAETYADSFGYQWNIHRKTQLDSYTGFPISRTRLFTVSGWSKHLEGERILEAGSGAGRYTEVLLQTGADVFSFDYSRAVEANWLNNGHMPNLHIFQADIFNIPLHQESFDKVICLGVLQHTPDPERGFKTLAKYVKPGGQLVIDVYKANLFSWLQWKYLLRPMTKRMNKEIFYRLVALVVPILIPFNKFMRMVLGRAGARLSPIVEYRHLGLPSEINKEWAVLDTFDMYSPAHDHPQSLKTVKRWFSEAGFANAAVQYGPNGIVGKGEKPGMIGSREY
jgi:SAM-dependent methyltransferase